MRSLVVCSLLLCFALSANCNAITSSDVIFHLFTQANPTTSTVILPNVAAIMLSQFSMSKDTIVTIHKHGESVNSQINSFLVPSYLNDHDVNVLAVHWNASSPQYTLALSNAPEIGRHIAVFLNLLHNSFSYDLNRVHIVGYGIGGHFAGIASRLADRPVGKITALNPSFDGWTHNSNKLRPSDAAYVEVLHATAGFTGYDRPCGHVDFYPNGGSAQPGCFNDIECSDAMSYVYFSESITSETTGGSTFEAISCDSYEQAMNNQCAGEDTAIFGGTASKDSPHGVYHFSTNTVPPFAQGPRETA